MSHYFIAKIKINDESEYRKYIEKSSEVFGRFKGRYIVIDNNPRLLEGNWDATRIVIIEFDSEADFDDWYTSPEYQEILKFRLNSANCDTILAKGL